MFKRNMILAYGTLVGLPLLVLIGVLQRGRGLTAPVAVAGAWVIQSDAARTLCKCSAMTIAQSGPKLIITLDDAQRTSLTGEVDQQRIVAAAPQRAVRLDSTVAGTVAQREMDGEFSIEGMRSPFRAVRAKALKKV
jgi:hypothetical protein